MPHTPSTTDPSSRFRSIFDKALRVYTKKTGENLLSLPLFRDLNACNSPEDILDKLQDPNLGLNQPGNLEDSLTKWLIPIVNILYAFSATLGEGVGLVFSPGKVVFAGVGILLLAAKDVVASQDALVDIFIRVGDFLRRLKTYTHVPLSDDMTEVIVNIMVEVLSILAIATRDIKQGRRKKFLRKLVGKRDIEDALGRLDKLTQEEARMAVAQILEATHGVHENVTAVRSGVQGVDDKVTCVRETVDRFLDVGEKAGATLQQIASDVGDKNRDDLRQKLRHWLSPPDPSVNYNTACSLHHEGTATWFTEGPVFADWKESGSLLWISGIPGSGKSVLSSAIIRDIKGIHTGSAYVAYFFFDFKDAGKQDSRAVLSSLLHQLGDQSESYFYILHRLYSTHRHGSEQPSANALKQCLQDMLTIPGRVPVYLLLDALDECPNTHGVPSSRRKVLDLVKELVELKRPNLRLCVTSRLEMDIRIVLDPLTRTSLSLHDQTGQNEDIVDYVSSVVHSDPELNMRGWREEDKELVITTLSRRAGGMFRWVHCQLEILRQCFARNLRRTLDELPKTLDATYERILREIPEQNRDDAYRLLQCLTVAIRPLRVEELAEVLAVEFTAGDIPKLNVDSRWGDQEQAVLLACSSLVAIVEDHDSRIVQFSHYSVKEFLTSERLTEVKGDPSQYHIRPEPAHTIMAQACLAILLQLDYSIDKETIKSFPLAKYAAKHFSKHAEFENVLMHIRDGVSYLLDAEKPHFAAWLWTYEYREPSSWLSWHRHGSPRCPQRPETIPLYFVAEFGFRNLVQQIILKRPQDVNARGGHWGTPLHIALLERHVGVSQLLLPHCADVDVRGMHDQTPLHLASEKGYVDIGQQLLDRNADINARRSDGKMPLHLAAMCGWIDFARMLLAHDADVHAQDNDHFWIPQHSPPFQRNFEALLVDSGANIQAQNKEGQTALHYASECGCHDIMRLLLDGGADVHVQDNHHLTPLHLASSQSNVEATQLLVECGANVQVRNSKGQTPLHYASGLGYHDIMRLLLHRGADVHVQDDNHLTPLHFASSQSNFEAAQLLVGRGANIQVQNKEGQTPLHRASEGGYHDIMRLLLDRGADVHTQDDKHETPLHLASSQGNFEAARLLVECGANVQVKNNEGQTSLHRASQGGYHDIMRLLLDRGADVHEQDANHDTPLHLASTQGNFEAAQLLVERGANVQVQNKDGRMPLHRASQGGYHDIMRLLLDRGADVHVQDDNHWTPLHLASSQRNFEAAQLLVERGAYVQVQNKEGQTPLHCASPCGYHKIMRLLLDRGADVHVQDVNHETPLHLALSRSWDLDAAQLFAERNANDQVWNKQGQKRLRPMSRRDIMLSLRDQEPRDRELDVHVQNDNDLTLHLASSQRFEVAQLLVECGANVQVRNKKGQTPLHRASQGGYHHVMRLLLDRGADVHVQDDNHETPLHLASTQGNFEVAQLLVEWGANVQVRNKEGQTPLHRAASQDGYHDIMRLLLDRGADVHAQDDNHETPLHLALWNIEAAQLLVERGANVQVQNKEGQTPLHRASQRGNHKIMRLLLDRGADMHAQDNNHLTPLHLASSWFWSFEAAQLLVECGANVQVQNKEGQTPLHYASQCGYHDIMWLLLDRGADVHAQDVNHETPLHLASFYGHLKATGLLLQYSANTHLQNKSGKTPFQVASERGHQEIMQSLSEHVPSEHKI